MSDEIKDLKKKLLSSRKNGYDRLSPEQLEAMESYCTSYKAFLDVSKTERLCAAETVRLAEAAGISKPRAHNLMLRRYGQNLMIAGQMAYLVVPDTTEAEETALEAETFHIRPTSQVKQGKDGKAYRTYTVLAGSSTYDTKEMSELINGLVAECKEQGIETLPPEELARMMAEYEENHRKKETV